MTMSNISPTAHAAADPLLEAASDRLLNVICGGNAVGKSVVVEAMLAARKHHDASQAGFVHIAEAQRTLADR